jgi:hypothetical protein
MIDAMTIHYNLERLTEIRPLVHDTRELDDEASSCKNMLANGIEHSAAEVIPEAYMGFI